MNRTKSRTQVALIHEVFWQPDGEQRLKKRLGQAVEAGADLAVLPELPLDAWYPAQRIPQDEHAEPPQGRRHETLASAARSAGIALLGSVIVVDKPSGTRRNRALFFDASGGLVATYDKLHLPQEPGFWEADHYEVGHEPPPLVPHRGLHVGLQTCSDIFRPQGSLLLGASGALAILAPRATEVGTYARWKAMIVANAVTSACHVVCVNRPEPESGVPLGGPSLAIAPDGTILAESVSPVSVVELSEERLEQAKKAYPGYLPVRANVYAKGWDRLGSDS